SFGASAVKKLTVNVGASGIDGITADSSDRLLTVSPNPVEGDINAACYFDARGAKFSVFTTNGQLMRTVKADVTSGTVVVIPAEQMAPGIYLLTVETPQRNYTARIIKK
ncbi:MAG: T9SS type A sorting domain-containing protein, partial [Porphyromonadaceae bacterium]|nr:T9SS type A sorting domain-containing protein [Porphyromonadaceae bacterium]